MICGRRHHFDYSKGVRGKYYQRILREGANIVVLDPDIAKAFKDSDAVNTALRSLLDLTRDTQRLTQVSGRPCKRCRALILVEVLRLVISFAV